MSSAVHSPTPRGFPSAKAAEWSALHSDLLPSRLFHLIKPAAQHGPDTLRLRPYIVHSNFSAALGHGAASRLAVDEIDRMRSRPRTGGQGG
jgi:hypothetical protein